MSRNIWAISSMGVAGGRFALSLVGAGTVGLGGRPQILLRKPIAAVFVRDFLTK